MVAGLIGLGLVSGTLAGLMAWQATESMLLTLVAYSVFGALGTILFATASVFRRGSDGAADRGTPAD